MHLVAMVFQLLGNFALLNELDKKLTTVPAIAGVPINFTTTTAVVWSIGLGLTPAPLVCSALSIGSIGAAVWAVQVLDPALLLMYIEPAAILAFILVMVTSVGINKKTLLGRGLLFWMAWAVGWFKVRSEEPFMPAYWLVSVPPPPLFCAIILTTCSVHITHGTLSHVAKPRQT